MNLQHMVDAATDADVRVADRVVEIEDQAAGRPQDVLSWK